MAILTKAISQSVASSKNAFVRSFSVAAVRQQARPVDSEFRILTDPLLDNKDLPSFMVGTENGFLPRQVICHFNMLYSGLAQFSNIEM
jgi:hypothetical protein